MKHLKLFNNESDHTNWILSNKYIMPNVINYKHSKTVMYRKILYDSELEYIETTGTQYIDTEIIPDDTTFSVETCIAITNTNQNGSILCVNDTVDNVLSRYYPLGYHKGLYACNFSGVWKDNNRPIITDISANIFYTVYSSINNNNVNIKCNNISKTVNRADGPINKSLYLFSRNNNNNSEYFVECKMKYMKIYQNNKLISYLIPVRKDNIGYIYDRIRNRLFENNGTGQFVLGPDI